MNSLPATPDLVSGAQADYHLTNGRSESHHVIPPPDSDNQSEYTPRLNRDPGYANGSGPLDRGGSMDYRGSATDFRGGATDHRNNSIDYRNSENRLGHFDTSDRQQKQVTFRTGE